MKSILIEDAKIYVTNLLKEGLTEDHVYHDLAHTLSVAEASVIIAKKMDLPKEDREILELSALFHDTGFVNVFMGHEEESKKLAKAFLSKKEYAPHKIDKVLDCIDATRVDAVPQTILQKVLKDADFNNLVDASYKARAKKLRHEWKVFLQEEMNDDDWLQNNLNFWENHKFYTEVGQELFGKAKSKNLKKLHEKVDKKNKKKDKIPKEALGLLSGSKSAQMMFKTTLRNHIDLTAIADNKANIMLSINALIITVTMPLLASNVKGNMFLLIPTSVLLVTCTLSIIFATLATRPVKTNGMTDISKLGTGATNLFFYGNFWKMPLPGYKQAIKEVVRDESELDDSVVNDLYFLGLALGRKFLQLRICYSIFMVGMTLTVLAFAVAFFYSV